jgi:asparagine synthase (glutamine-hydrolysing)
LFHGVDGCCRPNPGVATAALKHRGPDDDGFYEARVGDAVCGLVHTRLAIIDLSPGGHQPMSTPDGRYTIVFNGEIYNFKELRRALEGEVTFRSNCDTEVLLHAYARWGADCALRLEGMFAFAIWDKIRAELVLVRDRLGEKPLYYVENPHGITFASEIRALLETGAAERRLSVPGLHSYLAFGSVRAPFTILRDVRALLPGRILEHRDRKTTIRRYWQLPTTTLATSDEPSAAEETRRLLYRAVKLRLVADVPVGIFLSGGIDSSSLVAVAARTSDAPVHTFTLSYKERAWDERQYARQVAERFGCEHHEVLLLASRAAKEMESALAAQDQPSADGINSYFVSKAAKDAGLAVALSGVGADELFGGYPHFRLFQRLWRSRSLLRAAGKYAGSLGRFTHALCVPQSVRKLVALGVTLDDPAGIYASLRAIYGRPDRRAHPARFRSIGGVVDTRDGADNERSQLWPFGSSASVVRP